MLSEYTRHIHKLEERMQLAEERARVTSNVTQVTGSKIMLYN